MKLTKKTMIIGGLSLAIVGGAGFLFQGTSVVDEVFAQENSKLAEQAKLTEKEAEEIALERVSGEVVESEVEKEDGTIVFEFEIKTDSGVKEVEIDGNSGRVLEVEDEDEEDDDDEDENEDDNEK
ncbi:PepSY domain-containing protein [Halobacillus yeomjeoni]|uniref:PepSY domain-containing protein n=1 Tax=Halobacillus yeomjeoni TaxID=311194 RepID=A0A931HXS8_9BACI|nr:PepSY domain-containing protein [Halobacillus yeomjeoni]MBH0231411.1 PepSY domain-containing protein [Halobacillus yeomjeoni]